MGAIYRKETTVGFNTFIKGAEIVCAACSLHHILDCTRCKVMETGCKLARDEMNALEQEWLNGAMALYDRLVEKYKESFDVEGTFASFDRSRPYLLGAFAEADLSSIIQGS